MNIGEKAPEVLGINEKGEEIRLSNYQGKKVVLYFYPKDNNISDMLDDKDVAPLSNGVKIEIERPHNELDDMINPEQLNLF